MTRETYELEKIINKKLFSPYSPKYNNNNYIQNNENKNESENKNKNNNNNTNYNNNQNENNNEDNNKYFLEKAETYTLIRIMLSKIFNRVLPYVDSQY